MFVFVLILLVFGAGFTVGLRGRGITMVFREVAVKDKEPPGDLKLDERVDFSPFWKAWGILNEKYVLSASTTDQQKLWGAIEGLASSLKDPYTVFFPPEENELFETEISGKFDGIGIEIGIKDEILTVIAPLKGTPAEKAGLIAGDRIFQIDDTPAINIKVERAVKLIRGKRGTAVKLTVQRVGKKDPLVVTIIRDRINIPTIDTELKRDIATTTASGGNDILRREGIFIIKLYNFSVESNVQFRHALREFILSGSPRLILDLRGNPGGFLEAAVDIASWFLPRWTLVVTEDYGGKKPNQLHRSYGYNVLNRNLRMAVLINRGTASAAEILAGALHEHGIATLVGEETFGKGSVQELVHVTSDTSLKITVARWLTPKNISISEGGLKPDVEVKITPEDIEAKRDPQLDKAVEILIQGR